MLADPCSRQKEKQWGGLIGRLKEHRHPEKSSYFAMGNVVGEGVSRVMRVAPSNSKVGTLCPMPKVSLGGQNLTFDPGHTPSFGEIMFPALSLGPNQADHSEKAPQVSVECTWCREATI